MKRKSEMIAKTLIVITWLYIALNVKSVLAQDVYFNPANAQSGDVVEVIEYSAWSTSERTGMHVDYAGETSGWCVAGQITVRTADATEWLNNGLDLITGPDAISGSCLDTGWIILLNPTHGVSTALLTHELGHVLGYWAHSSSFIDLMYPQFSTPALTIQDALNIIEEPHFPLYDEPEICYTELTQGWELLIPDINGLQVLLTPLFDFNNLDDDTVYEWELAHAQAIPNPQGCEYAPIVNGEIEIPDIRTMGESYSVKFKKMSATVYRAIEVK